MLHMKNVKDNFSVQSEGYSKFRPVYPNELYKEILKHVSQFESCWDCATGNGQMAIELAPHFESIQATDISMDQLNKAPNVQILSIRKVEQNRHLLRITHLISLRLVR